MSGSRQLESGLCAVHTDPRCDWTTWKLLEMLKDVQSSTFRWLEGSFSGQFCRHLPDFYVFFLAAMCGWNVSFSSSNVRICCVLQPPNIKTLRCSLFQASKCLQGSPIRSNSDLQDEIFTYSCSIVSKCFECIQVSNCSMLYSVPTCFN